MDNGEETRQARNRLLRLLGFRLRSRHEAAVLLDREGFSGPAIGAALEEMQRLGYIDDARYCAEYTRSRFHRGYGPHRIRAELRQKGIDAALVEDQLASLYQGQEEADRARSLVAGKLAALHDTRDPLMLRRCAALLERRGYTQGVIRQVLREFFP